MLTDPDDINGGPKGYLKCDLAVVGKGDSMKVSYQVHGKRELFSLFVAYIVCLHLTNEGRLL